MRNSIVIAVVAMVVAFCVSVAIVSDVCWGAFMFLVGGIVVLMLGMLVIVKLMEHGEDETVD